MDPQKYNTLYPAGKLGLVNTEDALNGYRRKIQLMNEQEFDSEEVWTAKQNINNYQSLMELASDR